MKMVSKIIGLLGFAMRAGQVIAGEEVCLRAIRQHRVGLILLAVDAGANTAKKVRDKCAYHHVPLVAKFTREELGRAIGKDARTVIGVTSSQFAKEIQRQCGLHGLGSGQDLDGGDGF